MEDLKDLAADDFEDLKEQIKKIQYNRLLEAMTQLKFIRVPSVQTCPLEEPIPGQREVEKGGMSGQ